MATNTPPPTRESTMDLRDHERTFRGFVHFMIWSVVVSLVTLIVVALANA